MELLGHGLVYVKTGDKLKESAGGVWIPEQSQVFSRVGVVRQSQDEQLSVGEWVLMPIRNVGDIQGNYRSILKIDGEYIIRTEIPFLQGVITNEDKAMELSKQNEVILDYSEDVRPLSGKVFIRIHEPKSISDAGIKLPEFKYGRQPVYGTVLNVGPKVNEQFYSDKLNKGDLVFLQKFPSGGQLPHTGKEDLVVRVNATEVVAKNVSEDKWVPLGGRLLLKPIHPDIVENEQIMPNRAGDTVEEALENGNFTTVKVRHRRGAPDVLMSATKELIPRMGEVFVAGGGWSHKMPSAKGGGYDGGLKKYEPGTHVILGLIVDMHNGELLHGNEKIIIGEEEYWLVGVQFIDGILSGEVVDSLEKLTLDKPDLLNELKSL